MNLKLITIVFIFISSGSLMAATELEEAIAQCAGEPVSVTKLSAIEKFDITKLVELSEKRKKCFEHWSNRYEEEVQTTEAFKKAYRSSETKSRFAEGRSLVRMDPAVMSRILESFYPLFYSISEKKCPDTCPAIIPLLKVDYLYLTDSEKSMLDKHISDCPFFDASNKKCISERERIAKAIYPNFVHAVIMKTKYDREVSMARNELHNKKCGDDSLLKKYKEKIQSFLISKGFSDAIQENALMDLVEEEIYIFHPVDKKKSQTGYIYEKPSASHNGVVVNGDVRRSNPKLDFLFNDKICKSNQDLKNSKAGKVSTGTN